MMKIILRMNLDRYAVGKSSEPALANGALYLLAAIRLCRIP
jgi:hypothetical protein